MIRRNCRSASSIPAAVQRSAISPDCQRLTLRLVRRTHSIIDSHGLVEASVRFNEPVTPRRVSVERLGDPLPQRGRRARMGTLKLGAESLQPLERLLVVVRRPRFAQSPSDRGPVALGQVLEDVSLLVTDAALHRRPLTEHVTDRLAQRFRRRRSRIASPARDRGRARPDPTAARSQRSRSRSSPPRARAGPSTPSVVIPSATMFVRPFNSIPSSISTARRTSSRRRDINSPSALRVRSTNAREIDDFEVERARCSTCVADRLLSAPVAARRDAGKHPLQHHPRQRIAVSEVPVGHKRQLAAAVG